MWLIVVIGIVAVFAIFSVEYLVDPHPVLYVLSGIAFAYWLYFFMKGVTANLQASFRPHHITKLITTGVYSKLRHPIYSADIVLAWGVALTYPTIAMLFAVVWTTVVMLTWIYLEEKALIELFGDEYLEYRKRVPMLFPLKRI